MKAVIYVRVSTAEQVDNYSLQTQTKACKDYCHREGITVDRVFREEGESAKTTNRPQLQEMLDYCARNARSLDFVVVYRVDRLARQVHDHTLIRMTLSKLGISVRAVQETFDDTAAGRLIENLMASVAQFDNDLHSARTLDGMREALSQGRWMWRPPVGYMRPSDRRSSPSLTPDEEMAQLVRAAFEMVATGMERREALSQVTQMGLRAKNGRPLSPQTFGSMLKNPLYSGRIISKKWSIDVEGDFFPLISPDLFRAVQSGTSGALSEGRLKDHPDFPLRRIVRCGYCGTPLTASWSRGRNKRYPYYHCRKSGCGVNVRKEELASRDVVEICG